MDVELNVAGLTRSSVTNTRVESFRNNLGNRLKPSEGRGYYVAGNEDMADAERLWREEYDFLLPGGRLGRQRTYKQLRLRLKRCMFGKLRHATTSPQHHSTAT